METIQNEMTIDGQRIAAASTKTLSRLIRQIERLINHRWLFNSYRKRLLATSRAARSELLKRRTNNMNMTQVNNEIIEFYQLEMLDQIEYLRNQEQVTDVQLALLKSEKDEYSTMPYSSLTDELYEDEATKIEQAFDTLREKNIALRWVCRGLPVELAIRKVQFDKSKLKEAVEWKEDGF